MITMDLKEWLALLEREGLSLLIVKEGEIIFQSSDHGLKPLLEAASSPQLAPAIEGSTVIDKVVGKAGALLICYFQGKRVYARTLSRLAAKLLERNGVDFEAEEVVEAIGGGCPFEQAVLEIDDPEEAFMRLREIVHSVAGRTH